MHGPICIFWANLTPFSLKVFDNPALIAVVNEAYSGLGRIICRFVLPLICSNPDSLTHSVPLFLNRQCDRTPGAPNPGGQLFALSFAFKTSGDGALLVLHGKGAT